MVAGPPTVHVRGVGWRKICKLSSLKSLIGTLEVLQPDIAIWAFVGLAYVVGAATGEPLLRAFRKLFRRRRRRRYSFSDYYRE